MKFWNFHFYAFLTASGLVYQLLRLERGFCEVQARFGSIFSTIRAGGHLEANEKRWSAWSSLNLWDSLVWSRRFQKSRNFSFSQRVIFHPPFAELWKISLCRWLKMSERVYISEPQCVYGVLRNKEVRRLCWSWESLRNRASFEGICGSRVRSKKWIQKNEILKFSFLRISDSQWSCLPTSKVQERF